MNETGWIGVALAATTAVGAGWTAWVQRKGNRDKLEFDVKLKETQDEVTTLKHQHADCTQNHAHVEAKLKECERQHKTTDARLEALEAAARTRT